MKEHVNLFNVAQNKYYDINKKSKLFTQKDLDIIIVQDICKVSLKAFHNLVYVRKFKRTKALSKLIQFDKSHPYHTDEFHKKYFDQAVAALGNLVLFTTAKQIDYSYKYTDSESCMWNEPVGDFYHYNKIGLICSPNFRALINLQTAGLCCKLYGSLSQTVYDFLGNQVETRHSFILNKRLKIRNITEYSFTLDDVNFLKKHNICLRMIGDRIILTNYTKDYLIRRYQLLGNPTEVCFLNILSNENPVTVNNITKFTKLKHKEKFLYPYLDFNSHVVFINNISGSLELYEFLSTLTNRTVSSLIGLKLKPKASIKLLQVCNKFIRYLEAFLDANKYYNDTGTNIIFTVCDQNKQVTKTLHFTP